MSDDASPDKRISETVLKQLDDILERDFFTNGFLWPTSAFLVFFSCWDHWCPFLQLQVCTIGFERDHQGKHCWFSCTIVHVILSQFSKMLSFVIHHSMSTVICWTWFCTTHRWQVELLPEQPTNLSSSMDTKQERPHHELRDSSLLKMCGMICLRSSFYCICKWRQLTWPSHLIIRKV